MNPVQSYVQRTYDVYNGDSFKILQSGMYTLQFSAQDTNRVGAFMTLNGLTTTTIDLTSYQSIIGTNQGASTGYAVFVFSTTLYLNVNDVVRCHTSLGSNTYSGVFGNGFFVFQLPTGSSYRTFLMTTGTIPTLNQTTLSFMGAANTNEYVPSTSTGDVFVLRESGFHSFIINVAHNVSGAIYYLSRNAPSSSVTYTDASVIALRTVFGTKHVVLKWSGILTANDHIRVHCSKNISATTASQFAVRIYFLDIAASSTAVANGTISVRTSGVFTWQSFYSGAGIVYTKDATNGDTFEVTQKGTYSLNLLYTATASSGSATIYRNGVGTASAYQLIGFDVAGQNPGSISWTGALFPGDTLRTKGDTTIAAPASFTITQLNPSPTTFSPTSTPSRSPSKTPTTSLPSLTPTTSQPSKSPSQTPTTSIPSKSPSKTPTTSAPSQTPTTSAPSQTPTTSNPSKSPSQTPTTSKPSHSPTQSPTTSRPSRSPSLTPTTSRPSKSPSRSPSLNPTTSRPSKSPSSSPSLNPSTSRPSKSPSRTPTTSIPSQTPTTSTPSKSPSRTPTTSIPSKSPSFFPSLNPTTSRPSKSPSSSPSLNPSTSTPSKAPSRTPITTRPSNSPSWMPSSAPSTSKPSHTPSRTPSITPTVAITTTSPSKSPTIKQCARYNVLHV